MLQLHAGILKGSSQAVPLKCCRWEVAVLELLLGRDVFMEEERALQGN